MSSPKCLPFYQVVDGYRIPGFFSPDVCRSALSYKARPDDLFLVSYPKCGSNWVRSIISCIINKGEPLRNAFEFFTRIPFFEMSGAEGAKNMPRPGAIKTHLPFNLIPYNPEAKYIYLARNPKDCCVSFYYHSKQIGGYRFANGKFDDYFELFINGEVDFGDYFDNLLSWYEHRNDPNVLFITYEQLQEGTRGKILQIAQFMGSNYAQDIGKDPKFLDNIVKYSSFSYMKEITNKQLAEFCSIPKEELERNADIPEGLKKAVTNEDGLFSTDASSVNFVRKGIVGDWRNHFSKEQNERLEAKFYQKTKGTDIPELWKHCM